MEKNIRYKLWQQIRVHPVASERPTITNITIIFLIIAMIVILTIRSDPSLSPKIDKTLNYTQIIIWVCFVVEWIVRFWTSIEDERFKHFKHPRIHWLTRVTSWLDLIAILPGFFLIWGSSSNIGFALRLLRLIMLVRFFRFFRRSRSFYFFSELFKRHWRELILSLSFLITLVYILACILWLVEHRINPSFASIPEAFWWAVISVTTVGYGDVIPITAWGKFITGTFLLVSMAFVALPGAIMAAGFISLLQEEKQKRHHR